MNGASGLHTGRGATLTIGATSQANRCRLASPAALQRSSTFVPGRRDSARGTNPLEPTRTFAVISAAHRGGVDARDNHLIVGQPRSPKFTAENRSRRGHWVGNRTRIDDLLITGQRPSPAGRQILPCSGACLPADRPRLHVGRGHPTLKLARPPTTRRSPERWWFRRTK